MVDTNCILNLYLVLVDNKALYCCRARVSGVIIKRLMTEAFFMVMQEKMSI
jgi:hypothetical protein